MRWHYVPAHGEKLESQTSIFVIILKSTIY